ncbi:MAG: hypothetical protein J6Z14_10795 [Prevotella sp.]|nr:hypothetical protein [Prevotella sp.]
MNLYIRYFNSEALVKSADEAIEFLNSINEIEMNPVLEADIREYADSDVHFPKRYKIRPRVYFIIIKTEAASMLEFKENRTQHANKESEPKPKPTSPTMVRLNAEHEGWYEGSLKFKRACITPSTGKFQYRDTFFVARVKATSGMDCYNRIVDHLSQRVDERSQFPSVKGKNYQFTYLGKART